ncbi:MAG: TIGR02391 family protein [Devosia sp.]
MAFFSQEQLQAIADALGNTDEGLTGPEIGHLLETAQMKDPDPGMTKRHRLLNAFALEQNTRRDRVRILAFIRKAMKPARYLRAPERFEPMRHNLNRALSFAGLALDESGDIVKTDQVTTLKGAERRAQELRADLTVRGVHPDVLKFCSAELVADDYFHAVLEAVKSVSGKLRAMSGLTDDGGLLIDRTLGGSAPMLAINTLRTESEQSEQKGFVNLLKGIAGMYRNPAAHEARIHWTITKSDAEDLLSLVSMVHRRLDKAWRPPRT